MNKLLQVTTSWEIVSNNKLEDVIKIKRLEDNGSKESSSNDMKPSNSPVKMRAFLHPELPKLYPCDVKMTLPSDSGDVFAYILVISSLDKVEFIDNSVIGRNIKNGISKAKNSKEKARSLRVSRTNKHITYSTTKEGNNHHSYFIPLEETKEIIVRFAIEENIDLFVNQINVQIRNRASNDLKFKQNLMLPSHDLETNRIRASTSNNAEHLDVIKDLTHHMLCALDSDRHNLCTQVTSDVKDSMRVLLKNMRMQEFSETVSDSEEDDKKPRLSEEDLTRKIDRRLGILEAKMDYLISLITMKL